MQTMWSVKRVAALINLTVLICFGLQPGITDAQADPQVERSASAVEIGPDQTITITITPSGFTGFYAVKEDLGGLVLVSHTAENFDEDTFIQLGAQPFSYQVKLPDVSEGGQQFSIGGFWWTDPQDRRSVVPSETVLTTAEPTGAGITPQPITALPPPVVVGVTPAAPPSPGEPRVEALRVEPQQAEAGGQQNIVVEVFNPGEASTSVGLSLEIDGQVFETRSVQVAAGGREVTTFAVPALAPGSHGVKIGDVEARFVITSGGVNVGGATGCTLRTGRQVRLQNIVDTIRVDQDGHIELSFRNPPVNDCVVEADLRITVPANIIPIAKEGAISGSAGTLNAFVETPSGTERALIMDFKGQKKGEYFITFSGTYWPKGNKDLFQPITLQQKLIVESVPPPTSPFATATAPPATPPTPTPFATPVPPPTSGGGCSAPVGGNAKAGAGWMLLVLLIPGIALVRVGRKRRLESADRRR